MLAREIQQRLQRAATPIYGEREAQVIAYMLLEGVWQVTRTMLVVDPTFEVDEGDLEHVERQVRQARPVQYIIGWAEFCDLKLSVREGVLIPRPETEELVHWIVVRLRDTPEPRILDVGTGSGAIAIALATKIEGARVEALDISPKALEVADENIQKCGVDVELIEGDALRGVDCYVEGSYDLIVSNPPYIPQSESTLMRANVLDYEPHSALFVVDDDPLIFYRAIAESALELLARGGRLFYELHEEYAQECERMLEIMGYSEVELREDINGKPRMICASR
ncbi:MAG: peptide chain release factor N(5)-glutamine methyltransferase [Rikenellaceae bacterium]